MTEKLYWDRPYDTNFEAKIVDIDQDEIILDKTLFYPEGGNQTSDKGVIAKGDKKFKVKHVSKKGNLIVHHISEPIGEILKKDDIVTGEIDWEYRYGIMRAHSSQHVLSAVFKNLLDIDTVRANISYEDVSLHIERNVSESELKNVLIQFFNICTTKNLQFHSKIVPQDEVKNLDQTIRGGLTTDTSLRVIEIEDYDINCCGGTHIGSSSEIGPVFFYEIKKGKEFKYYIGNKAIEMLSNQNFEAVSLAGALNIPTANLLNTLKTQFPRLREENEVLILKILELIAKNPTTVLNNTKIGLVDFEVEYKLIAKAFKNFPSNYILIIQPTNTKLHILSNDDTYKANDIINKFIKKYGGKGGGSPKTAQATLENEPIDVISFIATKEE